MGEVARCAVCHVESKGCMTEHGFVCKVCIGHWLHDYLRMVNPFPHLDEKKIMKIKKELIKWKEEREA